VKKDSSETNQSSMLIPSPERRFCPECHRVIKYVVPSDMITYIVHEINDVCAIENEVVPNG
jgi:hypothetical protein